MLRNTKDRFGTLQIALHWLVVVLMICVYVGIECRGDFPKEIRPTLVRIMHYSFGISILFITLARIALRFSGPEPVLAPAPPVWQALLARLIHLALYAFMIAMPLLAWLYYSLKAKPLWFYGMELPPLLGADAALAKQLRLMYWHRHLAEWGYWLIGLHAAAALFHHYVVKDNALLRMLPRRRSMTASP